MAQTASADSFRRLGWGDFSLRHAAYSVRAVLRDALGSVVIDSGQPDDVFAIENSITSPGTISDTYGGGDISFPLVESQTNQHYDLLLSLTLSGDAHEVVPEPTSFVLVIGAAVFGLAWVGERRHAQRAEAV